MALRGSWVATVAVHAALVALAGVVLLPLAWMVVASLKAGADQHASAFLPGDPSRLTLANYRALFERQPFARWMLNSIFLSSTYTVIVVTLSSLGGFALAKYRFRGRRLLEGAMVATMLLPPQVLLLANYELMHAWGWIDSYAAVIVPSAVSVFGIFLFRQSMRGVPDELLAAARVDGCSELRVWWEVALPSVRPMLGAYALLSFVGAWNGYLWPAIVLQDEGKHTLPIGLANLLALPEYRSEFGLLMAGTTLAVAPVVALFLAMQREFVAGLASGGIKG